MAGDETGDDSLLIEDAAKTQKTKQSWIIVLHALNQVPTSAHSVSNRF